jgi:glycosyltransferase involved in cell wall biosynthesis
MMVEIVDGRIERDAMTQNARGGTEMMAERLLTNVDQELLQGVQIIFGRPSNLMEGYKHVLYLHDLPEDPQIAIFADPEFRSRFDAIVFVSDYQFQRFLKYFNIPAESNMVVIYNAMEAFGDHPGNSDQRIKFVYHTTPHRGLEILYPVFAALSNMYPDHVSLDVYSSFGVYGWQERDAPYQPLFQSLKDHPNINYHGAVSNEEIRSILPNMHCFAYPSIWEETSCLALIEAMGAGLDCIHPNYGALPETSRGLNIMYQYTSDPNTHAQILFQMMKIYVESCLKYGYIWNHSTRQIKQNLISDIHGIPAFKIKWTAILNDIR